MFRVNFKSSMPIASDSLIILSKMAGKGMHTRFFTEILNRPLTCGSKVLDARV